MNEPVNKMMMSPQRSLDDSIDIKEFLRIVLSNRKSIALIVTIVLGISFYIALTTQPVYESTSVVLIEKNPADASSFVFDFGSQASSQMLKNEIEVLNSYTLHSSVVKGLIENGQAKRNALFGTRYIKRRYRALTWLTDWIVGEELPPPNPDSLSREELISVVQKLRENTTIKSIRDTDVLKLSVKSSDSTDAVFLTNVLAQKYQNQDVAGGLGEIKFVLTFLDSQIFKYSERLASIEEEIQQFQINNNIYTLDGSAELLLKDLTHYESIYYTNIAELEVSTQRVQYLKSQLSQAEQRLIEEIVNTNNPMIVALRNKIAELEAQRIQQMVDEGWAENSLQARDFDRRIDEMKVRLQLLTKDLILSGWSEEDPFAASQEIFNRIVDQEVVISSSRSRAEEYNKLVETMSDRLKSLPSQTLSYARLDRERKLNENLYLTMKQKYEESRITEAGKSGKVKILDPALVAEKVKPKRKRTVILGGLLGAILGLGFAFFREFLDDTIKAVEELERKGLTVLGIIPALDNGDTKSHAKTIHKDKSSSLRRLILHEDPKSPISEAYRTIRTNISYSRAEKQIKSVLVSSAQPGEGKSTTVANLAIAFAQLRKRTLLIDADLRKPVQHKVFNHPRGPGLTDYLVGELNDIDGLIQKTEIENLYLITAGHLPPNPSELLGSNRMQRLIARLEEEWDMVLLDSPPLVAVTDASMMSGEIDALLLVIKASSTQRSAVERALDVLNNVKAPLAGVVLNAIKPENLGGKYSYYYSYYQYYSNDEADSESSDEKA